ncbi:DUF885 domain-containing protein [Dactylosporangium sp. NPDC005555]|uniref:DUF885 domain-containing protein n=1 Tax=Dactylosporangium sp. NPDC005555 TaxID=3154889 RepID=UPI0033B33637
MDTLGRLGDEYFRLHFDADPLLASVFGVEGRDSEVPDPSREAAHAQRGRLARVEAELGTVAREGLSTQEKISHTILGRLLRDEQRILHDGVSEVAVTASIAGPLAQVVSAVPMTRDAAYVARLGKLAGYFDGHAERYQQAAADGRFPTELGVRQAIAQVDAYLSTPVEQDPLLRDADQKNIIKESVRPALQRFRTALDELPGARGDDKVGLCHVPGGPDAYRTLIAAYTTTEFGPEEIHQIGLDLVAGLREEFKERGGRALKARSAEETITRLRDDKELRFTEKGQIVDAVTAALRKAEEAVPDWFARYDIAPCVVKEMDPAEAENSVLGYYVAPAADGSRPGAHVVNTFRPESRARFEYEVLAFHESVPGHHLQIAVAQSRDDLPRFRRFTYFDAHGEGWGLYTERLTDEMGLYTSELSRLGMVSFDAWRACRLVVDTGMHHFGWSRERAISYMRDNTALTETNIANEVDRYIAMPGQALAYMLGRLRIQQLRERERAALGPAFDIRAFHHEVLAHGPLPLDTLEELVASRW